MSELDDFMRWCSQVSGSEEKDSFGHPMSHSRFPQGEISWWVNEYRRRKK